MKRILGFLAVAALALPAQPLFANDSTAQLGTGGLVFITNYDVKILSEDLYVSPEEVRVKYEFRNDGETDQNVLIAFPMPDIEGSGDFNVDIPTEDPENIFGFETLLNGESVDAELHQYAFAVNIDQSEYLRELGVPLAPFGQGTQEVINELSDEDHQRMQELGLVIPMEYDSGQGAQTDYVPVWTLRSTYSWEAEFPVGETVTVEHRYKPSYGGTVAVTFLEGGPDDDWLRERHAEYQQKYCVDDGVYEAVEKTVPSSGQPYDAPFYETWLSYIWSTGANWGGPIGKFTLTVDKGDKDNLVSFCWDGEVKKVGPTQFRAKAEDWYPPYGRELEIMILVAREPVSN